MSKRKGFKGKCVSQAQCRMFGAWIGQGHTKFKDKVRGVKIKRKVRCKGGKCSSSNRHVFKKGKRSVR